MIHVKMFLSVCVLCATSALAQNSQQLWKRIEADNGAVYAIDVNSISHDANGRGTFAILCTIERNTCPLMNMTRVVFDCKGHYTNIDHGNVSLSAPPRSVIGRLADIACVKTNKTVGEKTPDTSAASRKDASEYYESRYFLAGFLLRASKVCQGEDKNIETALSLLQSDELKALSQNFPSKTEEWMSQGAANFNSGVLKSGIPDTCTYALKVLQRADEVAKSTR